MYARTVTIPANQPFSLYRLSNISPMAKSRKIIPANEIHIFNIDNDMIFTSTPLNLFFAHCIISYDKYRQYQKG